MRLLWIEIRRLVAVWLVGMAIDAMPVADNRDKSVLQYLALAMISFAKGSS